MNDSEDDTDKNERRVVEVAAAYEKRKKESRSDSETSLIGRHEVPVHGFRPAERRPLGEEQGDVNLARFARLLQNDREED